MADVDPSPVYIVERGRLQLLSSRYTRAACGVGRVGRLPRHLTDPAPPPRSSLSVSVVPPLTSIASVALVRHFDRVDSLEGLPDDLGRWLFEAGLEMDLFSPANGHALRIFAGAFGGVFADRLDLRGVDMRQYSSVVSGLLTQLVFSVRELCLDGCRLDAADRSLLVSVAGLKELRRLSIRENDLWDETIRSLTAGWRFRRSDARIAEIDLRGNKYLSHTCIRFFLDIPSLTRVTFSSSSELELEFPLRECCKRRWRLKRRLDGDGRSSGSSGWFSEIHRSWIAQKILPELIQDDLPRRPCLILYRDETPDVLKERNTKRRVLGDAAARDASSIADDDDVIASYLP